MDKHYNNVRYFAFVHTPLQNEKVKKPQHRCKIMSKNICVMNVMTLQETFKPEVNTILF